MLSLLSCFFVLFAGAASRINLPNEVLTAVSEEYPSEKPIKPILDEATLTFETVSGQGEKSSQTVKVGITQDTIDLAAYVDKNAASLTITFKPAFEMTEQTKLFFINRYRETTHGSAPGGLACGKALKIQKNLKKLFSTQGVKFMTNDGAYLNLLGGDFLITHLEGSQLHVVFFKIVDGRFSSRLCKIK